MKNKSVTQRGKQKKLPDGETITAVENYMGPLPHPDILEKFDQVSPGAAERIIKMAEDQQKHVFEIEKRTLIINEQNHEHYRVQEAKTIESEIKLKKNSLNFSIFFVIPLFLIAAVFLAMDGKEVVASIVGGSTILGLAVIIILRQVPSKKKQDQEKNEK